LQVACADEVGRDQLRVRVDGDPRPHVAVVHVAALVGRHVLLLAADERPNLVALDALARQVAHHAVLMDRADGAEIDQQLRDGVLRHARHPHGRADAVAFNEAGDYLLALLRAQTIHTDYYT
jgi:hypothetical protein